MFDGDRMDGLKTLFQTERCEQIVRGESGAEVYHLPDIEAYLKVAERGAFCDLTRERDALEWLSRKALVPKVLGFETHDDKEYLLTSAIAGSPASDLLSSDDISVRTAAAILEKAAVALRSIHYLDITRCLLEERLDAKFARAWKNIQKSFLSEARREFVLEHGGKLPEEVHGELNERRPLNEDLVFIHGDPCMPNIIVLDGEISGFIDLDGAGVADRYTDFAVLFGSFKRNCRLDVDHERIFFEAYGLIDIDREKLDFYIALDDLF